MDANCGGARWQPTLEAQLRLDNSILDRVISLSGRESKTGLRFYFKKRAMNCSINWIKKAEDEDKSDYANRVAAAAGPLGVAMGDSSLGVRVSNTDPHAEVRRTWRILGTPARMEADEFLTFIDEECQELREVSIIKRLKARNTTTWFVISVSTYNLAARKRCISSCTPRVRMTQLGIVVCDKR